MFHKKERKDERTMKLSTLIFIYELLEDEKRNLKEQLHEVTETLSDFTLSVRDEIIMRLQEVDVAISDLMGGIGEYD